MPLRTILSAVIVAVAGLASLASADPRPFSFVYDTYPEGKGNWEYEQWVTWRHGMEGDNGANRVDFRHEFEIGLADNFDLAVYLPTWHWEDAADHSGTRFDSVGVEAIVYLSNPVTDKIGSGLYFEINVGEDELEFEPKLLLHKDIGNWTFAYNLVLETEIEGVFSDHSNGSEPGDGGGVLDEDEENDIEVEGVLGHALGVSYAFENSGLRLGGEMTIESVYENWNHYEDTTVYAGPVLSYTFNKDFWLTVTPVVQLTDNDAEADYAVRMVAGFEF